MDRFEKYYTLITDWAIVFVPKLIIALAIFFIGFWAIKKVVLITEKSLQRVNTTPEISSFLSSILDITLKFIVVLAAAGMIGFEVSSLLGILAAAAFAIGLALQGFMGNFASGITIVFFKPYKIGDWVEIADKFGKVENIQIFNTIIVTPGQKTIVIPNGKVTDSSITNFSAKGVLRLELNARIPYEESFPKVRSILIEVMQNMPEVLKDPAPAVGILEYESHDIILAVQPFINPEDFWEVTYKMNEEIKKAFNKNGIKMAYSEGVEIGKIGE